MGKNNSAYSEEFKDSAMQLALNSEQSVSQVARDLGISIGTLHNWLYKRRLKESEEQIPKTKESLEDENKRLRKELALVKEEREILKKATAYFANEAH
jgi:transposase